MSCPGVDPLCVVFETNNYHWRGGVNGCMGLFWINGLGDWQGGALHSQFVRCHTIGRLRMDFQSAQMMHFLQAIYRCLEAFLPCLQLQ
jgi:hypothetical protein